MPLFSTSATRFAERLVGLAYANPFLPEYVEWERKALGPDFEDKPRVMYHQAGEAPELDHEHPNLTKLDQGAEETASKVRERLRQGAAAGDSELVLYEDLVLYLLYRRYREDLRQLFPGNSQRRTPARIPFWERFLADFDHFLIVPGRTLPGRYDPAHVFACFFQIRRAFYQIYYHIVGASPPVAQLRGAVWQSIFTHDMRRYARALYERMHDFATLVTGPSGTGKELVARAVGLSRYLRFDAKECRFTGSFAGPFHALNLSALAPTLIESELFGHKKGAFTGAVQDRPGWLELCEPGACVFLDEVGELNASIQVKLLRVLQSRTFQRLGDTEDQHFGGKIIAATNRDLAAEMRDGRFREDFYYRLCGDVIATPSLRDQLAAAPNDLRNLLRFIARRITGDEGEALADEAETWIHKHPVLGRDYSWPGNFRELEQCVRNILIRKEYHPASNVERDEMEDPRRTFADAVIEGRLTADELERRYCTLSYARTESFEETARQLQLNWRTIKSKIDHNFLHKLRASRRPDGAK